MTYKDLNDYEILSYIAENDEEARNIMIEKYKPLIISIATRMINHVHNTGLDINDLVQEGMIGFDHAMDYFNDNRNIKFYTYAKTCIERKMISTIISAHRQKNRILSESVSYDDTEDELGLQYLLKDNSTNPEHIIMSDISEENIINEIKNNLTSFEAQVFELMLSSFNYREIAEMLDKDKKQVDNAIQRIKSKARGIIVTNKN